MMLSPTIHAQKKKGPYVAIDSLLKSEKYTEAKNRLVHFNKQNPENALSRFELAKIHKRKFERLYIHNFEDIAYHYDAAVLLFEQAHNLVTKKELKINRAYYDEMFGRKAYTIESIQAHMNEYVQSMQRLFTKLTQLKLKLSPIPDEYEFCQTTFVKVISNYQTLTDLYLHISEYDLKQLAAIETKYAALQNSISAYTDFFRDDSFADLHQQSFQFATIKGMNAYRVDKQDFLKKSIKLFDYQTWAKGVRSKVEEVKQLKQRMYQLDSLLSELLIVEQYEDSFSPEVIGLKLETWKRQMLEVDQHANKVMELFDLKMLKLNFLHRQQVVRKEFAISYPDSATRDQYIGELIDLLLQLNEAARSIDIRESAYKNHLDFVKSNYGGRQGLLKMGILEENYVTSKLLEWNTIRAKMPDLAPVYPDSTSFADGRLILRPAKMNIRSLLDSGFLVTERLYPCQDSGFVLTGQYEIETQKRLFVGKISRAGEVLWLKRFDDETEITHKLEKVTPFANGMTLLFNHIQKGEALRLKMMVLSDTGSVILERLVAEVPQQMYFAQNAPGVIFVKQQQQISGMLDGFEKYEIVGFRFDGGKTLSTNLLLRGNIVDILTTGDGIRMVGNFLEYQDLNGQFADSRAYIRNGYNVFVANIYLTDDKENTIQPIFSLEPIAVSKVELDVDGKLVLHGFKGDFKYNGPENIVGGEVWETLVE